MTKGFTKKDAANLYAELNKIHKQSDRARNYTKMKAGQKFTYTAAEMQAMAKAAGYAIVRPSNDNEEPPIEDEQNQGNIQDDEQAAKEALEAKKQETTITQLSVIEKIKHTKQTSYGAKKRNLIKSNNLVTFSSKLCLFKGTYILIAYLPLKPGFTN